MIPFIFGVCLIFRTFVVAPTAPYYYSYVVGDMLEYATFSTATNVAGVIAVIVGPLFLVKVAKNNLKGTMLLFTVCVILCHLSLLIVGHDKNWFLVTMTLATSSISATPYLSSLRSSTPLMYPSSARGNWAKRMSLPVLP